MPLMARLKQAMKGRSTMVEKGIDRAVAQVNKRTGGKYGDTLAKRADYLKQRARQLDDRAGSGSGPGPDQPAPGYAPPEPENFSSPS